MKIGITATRVYALLYLLLIPLFAVIYWTISKDFYQSTAQVETETRLLEHKSRDGLEALVNAWFAELKKHEADPYSPKVRNLSLGGLTHLVIHKSRIFHSKSLNCGGGIHSALKSDPKGFGTRFAIAFATKEAA